MLDLDRIASLRAELDLATNPDEILAREGLTREIWQAEVEELMAALADEIDRGEKARSLRFAELYDAARARALGLAAPRPARGEPMPVDPPAPTEAPPVDVDATAMTDARAILQGLRDGGLPFDKAQAPHQAAPEASALQDQSGETQAFDARAIMARVTEQAAEAPVAPTGRAAEARAVNPVVTPSTSPPRENAFKPAEAAIDVDATAMTDASEVLRALRAGPLPFDKKGSGPVAPPAATAPQQQSGRTEELERETMLLQAKRLAELPMPLDRFAALQAVIARWPNRDEALHAHGVDPSRWPDILRAFGDAMKADPALRSLYEELLTKATRR